MSPGGETVPKRTEARPIRTREPNPRRPPASTRRQTRLALDRGLTGFPRTPSERRALAAHLDRERDTFVEALFHADAGEGIRAFLDKRPPRFNQNR